MINAKTGLLCGALAMAVLAGCVMSGKKPALKLAGNSWTATGIADNRGGTTGLIAGSKATLNFGTDGVLSGSAGCNGYTGRYEVTGNQVRFPNAFASTRKMCVTPGVMEQEQAFFKALSASTTGHIDGRKLELRDAAGALQIAASGN